jgi:hypothetical protein
LLPILTLYCPLLSSYFSFFTWNLSMFKFTLLVSSLKVSPHVTHLPDSDQYYNTVSSSWKIWYEESYVIMLEFQFLSVKMRSIWLWVFPSEVYVLWMLLFWNYAFLTLGFLIWKNLLVELHYRN